MSDDEPPTMMWYHTRTYTTITTRHVPKDAVPDEDKWYAEWAVMPAEECASFNNNSSEFYAFKRAKALVQEAERG
jgi:hypothetical protein